MIFQPGLERLPGFLVEPRERVGLDRLAGDPPKRVQVVAARHADHPEGVGKEPGERQVVDRRQEFPRRQVPPGAEHDQGGGIRKRLRYVLGEGFSGTVWTLALTLTLAPPPVSAGRPRLPATAPARRTAPRREPRLAFQCRSAGRRTSGSIYPAVNADPREGRADSRGSRYAATGSRRRAGARRRAGRSAGSTRSRRN